MCLCLLLRSGIAAWVAALDDAAVGIVHLVVPHLDTVLEKIGNVDLLTGGGLPCQILSGVLEGICIVTAIVLHGALEDIQLGKIGQLIIPLHGGHATGCFVVGIVASCNVVTLLVVLADQQRLVLVINF